MYPTLPKSYKRAYPFKIGTTSFIYPDHIIPNIRKLGPYLDEIELLIFESTPDSLPTGHEIKKIGRLAEEFDLTYNVHLPIDISLSAPDPDLRQAGLETVRQIIDLTMPLSPSTCTLHLPYHGAGTDPQWINKWREVVYQSMQQLVDSGINAEKISIETLTYPLEWIDNIINDFNFSVCIDIGHLLVHGFDMEAVFNKYCRITSIIHLHGIENKKDHLALDKLSTNSADIIMRILKRFGGVVSLEVFSYSNLLSSLNFLENSWRKHAKNEKD